MRRIWYDSNPCLMGCQQFSIEGRSNIIPSPIPPFIQTFTSQSVGDSIDHWRTLICVVYHNLFILQRLDADL